MIADVAAGGAPTIRVEGDGAVRRILLDRPARHNAQTPNMWLELAAAGRRLMADPTVRAVIVTGNGPSFSSGIDLDEVRRPDGFIRRLASHAPGDPDPMLADIAEAQAAISWIPVAPFLVVAAVTGAALGAGCQLALACDVRIVADDARLALAEVRLGLLPDLGATWTLPRLVGRERALDLILTGKEISGAEAARIGLASQAVPVGEVSQVARDYAERAASLPRPLVSYLKAAIDAPDLQHSLAAAAAGQAACIRVADDLGFEVTS